jgi:ribosomal protein S18 acetylase RimI-like enzyme
MFSMFEQMDAYHPREVHWHLPLIGVDPAHQGRGIGSALPLLGRRLFLTDGGIETSLIFHVMEGYELI